MFFIEVNASSDIEHLWSIESTNSLLVNIEISHKQDVYRLHLNVVLDFHI